MRTITYPINWLGAEALNDFWGAEGDGIITVELPEDEFSAMEFDVFGWAFDEFDIDIGDYEDDIIPYEKIDHFINRINELQLHVPVFMSALKTAKSLYSIVYASC